MIRVPLAVGLLLLSAVGPPADLSALLQQALDQPTQIQIKDTPITEALDLIAKQSGVTIAPIDPDCLTLLPYGRDTLVTAELRNIPLRQGLAKLLAPLGLVFELRDHTLEIVPMDALARIGRRATWDELKRLNKLCETRWAPGSPSIEPLRESIQFKDIPEKDPWLALVDRVQRVGAGKAAEVLTLACKSLGWTWYPSDDQIVITPEARQIERQLDRLIELHQMHRPLIEVIQELARDTGVRIRIDPQAEAALPRETRKNFTLVIEGYSGREALDRVAAATGLTWRIEGDAVALVRPGTQPPEMAPTLPSTTDHPTDPVMMLLTLPAPDGKGQFQILLRESDLSPELRRFREEQIDEFNRAMTTYLQTHTQARP